MSRVVTIIATNPEFYPPLIEEFSSEGIRFLIARHNDDTIKVFEGGKAEDLPTWFWMV